jgi:hypothetical protein
MHSPASRTGSMMRPAAGAAVLHRDKLAYDTCVGVWHMSTFKPPAAGSHSITCACLAAHVLRACAAP